MLIQNSNSQQIRMMGAGSNILQTYSDIADANGIQIRSLVSQGIDSTQNPITSITSDYQYATKGYTDNAITSATVQSLIQDNNTTPNVILQTSATDMVLTNASGGALTYSSSLGSNIQTSSGSMIFNAFSSGNNSLVIGSNLQQQNVNAITKSSSNPSASIF